MDGRIDRQTDIQTVKFHILFVESFCYRVHRDPLPDDCMVQVARHEVQLYSHQVLLIEVLSCIAVLLQVHYSSASGTTRTVIYCPVQYWSWYYKNCHILRYYYKFRKVLVLELQVLPYTAVYYKFSKILVLTLQVLSYTSVLL